MMKSKFTEEHIAFGLRPAIGSELLAVIRAEP